MRPSCSRIASRCGSDSGRKSGDSVRTIVVLPMDEPLWGPILSRAFGHKHQPTDIPKVGFTMHKCDASTAYETCFLRPCMSLNPRSQTLSTVERLPTASG